METSTLDPYAPIPGVTALPPKPGRREAMKALWAIREAAIASGMKTMTLDEITEEMARRRGEDPDA